ncbi:MAG: nicotinate-nucleotide--dimethylbenzimidazole phosphoribosyltransferase [Clostridia bacterium]|nr:nicotinate-nucleotide--dimethylbenzimidazole phosphoribosyltransferase [Clostridia bacterium]
MIFNIPPLNENARRAAHEKWAACAHPLGGLGTLETVIEDIAARTGSADISLKPRCALILCADNGVTSQGVTQTDSSVTAVVAQNLAAGRTSVCRMAAIAGCEVIPVDMGIKDFVPVKGVLDRRVANGTNDITIGAAMTRQQAEQAILTGIELVREQKERGIRLIAAGEMGIGNTTTASAVSSVLLGLPCKTVTGRGAGLSDEGLRRKIAAINKALKINCPDKNDPVDVLAKVGGFDIAGLCGVFLGGAIHKIPIIMDGAISAAAALCAVRLSPDAGHSIIASHLSKEPCGQLLLEALGKNPLITAEMHLGEGTGAVAAMPLLDMALAVYSESYTFFSSGITPYKPFDDQ